MTLDWVAKNYRNDDPAMGGGMMDMAQHITEILEHRRTTDWRDDPFADLYGL